MVLEIISTIAKVFAAIGTVTVAVLAIWGDKVRAVIAGPKLALELQDTRGDVTVRANQKKSIYYHLKITNKRKWSPAKNVRVLVTGIEKKRPDGTYFPEPLVAPLQLTWAFPQFHELRPTIATNDVCDLGFLDEDGPQFKLSLYVVPYNFKGYVEPMESMLVRVVASADNCALKSPLVLQISWNGEWSSDLDEMQRHLVIKEIQ